MEPTEPWARPTLTGDRVRLRPTEAADAEWMWEMVNDPEVDDLTGSGGAEFTRPQIEEWCATRHAQPHRLDLAIVDLGSGEVAGEAVLNEFDPATSSCNFRIALRGPAWFGRGLGGEATRLIVQHGLHALGLQRITLTVLRRNPRAVRAYQSAGFTVVEERHEDGDDWLYMEIRATPPLHTPVTVMP